MCDRSPKNRHQKSVERVENGVGAVTKKTKKKIPFSALKLCIYTSLGLAGHMGHIWRPYGNKRIFFRCIRVLCGSYGACITWAVNFQNFLHGSSKGSYGVLR